MSAIAAASRGLAYLASEDPTKIVTTAAVIADEMDMPVLVSRMVSGEVWAVRLDDRAIATLMTSLNAWPRPVAEAVLLAA